MSLVVVGKVKPIRKEHYCRLEAWLSAHANHRDAMSLLGVSQHVFELLIKEGFVKVKLERGGGRTRYFCRRELEEVVSKAASAAAPLSTRATKKQTPLLRAARGGRSVAGIVRALFDGRVQATGVLPNRRGLAAICVDPGQLASVAQEGAERLFLGSDATKLLGMTSTRTLLRAAEAGLIAIQCLPNATKEAGCLVAESEVQRFNERYATLTGLHASIPFVIPIQTVQKTLERGGATSVLPGLRPGVIYPKKDAEKALASLRAMFAERTHAGATAKPGGSTTVTPRRWRRSVAHPGADDARSARLLRAHGLSLPPVWDET